MFLLFFLLWLLLSGGVSLHACLWGLAVSALLTWFCRRVLGYDWRIFCGRPARIWALIRYFAHLVAEMLKAGLMVMKIIYVHPKKITPKLVWFRTPLQTDRHKAEKPQTRIGIPINRGRHPQESEPFSTAHPSKILPGTP